MKAPPKKSWARRLARWLGILALSALVLAVSGLVYWQLRGREQARVLVNQALGSLLVGAIEVRRFESVSLFGAEGVDAVLRDPQGHVVAEVEDLSARVAVLPLVWNALVGSDELEVVIEDIHIRHARLHLAEAPNGELTFLQAVTVRPEPPGAPTAPSRPVAVALRGGRIDGAWVHGSIGELGPIDLGLRELPFEVVVGDTDVAVQVERAPWRLRAVPQLGTVTGKLEAELRYALDEKLPLEEALSLVVVKLNADGAGRRLELDAAKRKERVDATVELAGLTQTDFAQLGVPFASPEPTALRLTAHGTAQELALSGGGRTGATELSVEGTAQLQPQPRLEAHIDIERLELQYFAPEVKAAPVSAAFDVKLEGSSAHDLTGELQGRVEPARIADVRIPALELTATLGARGLTGEVRSVAGPGGFKAQLKGPHPLQASNRDPYEVELWATVEEVAGMLGQNPGPVSGTVYASGSFQPETQQLTAHAQGQVTGLELAPDARMESLTFTARAHGQLANPELQLDATAHGVKLQGREFEEVQVSSTGTLSHSTVSVQGHSPQTDVELQATWAGAPELSVRAIQLHLREDDQRLFVAVERVWFVGDRVHFERLALQGAGQMEVTGHVSSEAVALSGWARDLDLTALARVARVSGYENGGFLDLDSDWGLDINQSKGRLSLRLAQFLLPAVKPDTGPAPRPERLSLVVDAIGEGPAMLVHVEAETDAHAQKDGTTSQAVKVEVDTTLGLGRLRSLFDGAGWADSALELTGRGSLDLGPVSNGVLAQRSLAVDGQLSFEGAARRVRQAAPPQIDLEFETTGLTARSLDETQFAGVRSIEDIDLRLRYAHTPETSLNELRAVVLYKQRPLARLELELTQSLQSFLSPGLWARLQGAPVTAELRLPRRRINAFPSLVGMPDMNGTLDLTGNFEGSLARPHLELEVRAERLGPDAPDAPVIDGVVHVNYDGHELRADAEASQDQAKRLNLHAQARYPQQALLEGRAPDELEGQLEFLEFPLELWAGALGRPLRGQLDGQVQARHLGTPQPELKGELTLKQVEMDSLRLEEGHVKVELAQERMAAQLEAHGQDWSVQGQAETQLLFPTPWSPTLGDKQTGQLRAKQLRLIWLMPLVADSVAELDGRLDLALDAQQSGAGTVVEAHAQLRQGHVQVPALGQQLEDVEADLDWTKDGHISLHDASFRGLTGRGTLEGSARMDGLMPRELEAQLVIDRRERLPLTLEGFGLGEIYGRIKTRAVFHAQAKRIDVDVRVEEFDLRMPEIPSANVQALDEDPHIASGVYLEGKRFAVLPLQPLEEEVVAEEAGWTVDTRITLGSAVWVQQGPTRRVQIGGGLHIVARGELELSGQLTLSRGRIELNGRLFDINEGTITFRPEEPANPIVVAEASWTSPEGIVVFASFVGPVESGKLTLRSEPPLSQGEILSLVLFGTTDGLNNLGSASADGESQSTASQAVAVGGGVATQGFNQALSRLNAVDVSTRINSDASGNARPEVVVQLTSSLSAQVGYSLEAPSPGKSPDRTLLVLELRLMAGHALATTIGDKGTGIIDWTWRYRY